MWVGEDVVSDYVLHWMLEQQSLADFNLFNVGFTLAMLSRCSCAFYLHSILQCESLFWKESSQTHILFN